MAAARHAVIMAGGSGTRLWPLSRRARPKQLLPLFDGRCLLELARARLGALFAPEHVWIVTARAYLDDVARVLPDVPRDNLIGEPVGRDTANAIALAAELLARRDPGATMAVFTADHLVTPQDAFEAAIRRGLAAAEAHDEALVTFGIPPTEPHTGYGYIELGEPLAPGVRRAVRFIEKPDAARAEQFARSGRHVWNSGMFAWRLAAIRVELERRLPDQARGVAEVVDRLEAGDPARADAAFAALTPISIDYGVMERAEMVLVADMPCTWLDLGSWTSIAATRPADAAGNVAVAPAARFVDSRGCIVVAEDEHLVVTLGVRDLVVVRSGDATLVCHRDALERVRELVRGLPEGRL